MRRSATALLTAALVLCVTIPLSAELATDQTVVIPSARTAAIGGVHVALADDLATLFSNPAGFRSAGPELSFAELTVGLAGPIFSIADLFLQVNGDFSRIPALITTPSVQSLFKGLYAAGNLNGPLAFGYVGSGLGFGFFNKTGVVFTSVGTIPKITASLEEDMLFAGGYAFRIPLPEAARSTLDLGVMLKAFVEGKLALSKSIVELVSLFTSPSPDILLAQPFSLDVGLGVDAGIRYSWNELIAVGIVGRNLYAPTMINGYATLQGFLNAQAPAVSFGLVPIDLSAGIMVTPPLGPLDRYMTDLKIFLDYQDILDFVTHPATATNPVLHVGLGVELVVLKILALRGGFYNGYFSAGLGLDLGILKLNLAMFGTELSGEPGLRPVYNLLLGLELKT